MKSDYQPIDCHYHDRLLDHATLRQVVKIAYSTAQGPQETMDVIKDVYTKEGAEYLLTKAGITIRLDHLLAVDGVEPPSTTACSIASKQ